MQFLNSLQEGGLDENAALAEKWRSRLQAFEELASKWKLAGLSSLQAVNMPKDSHKLTHNKELLAEGRKNLGLRTRSFSELTSSAKLQEFSSLLKGYQQYVDTLTQCLGDAESAYFTLHHSVGTMPDPYPLLERFLRERSSLLEYIKGYTESRRLKALLEEREEELSQLNNQEVTIKTLRRKLTETEMMAARHAEEASTNEVEAVVNEWQRKESELRAELAAAQTLSRRFEAECKSIHESHALLRMRINDADAQRDNETKQLVSELDESLTKISLLQREVDRLSRPPPVEVNTPWEAPSSMELEECKADLAAMTARYHALEEKSVAKSSVPFMPPPSMGDDALAAEREKKIQSQEVSLRSLQSELISCRRALDEKVSNCESLTAKCQTLESERRPLIEAVRRLENEYKNSLDTKDVSSSSGAFDLQGLLEGAPNKAPPGDEAFLAVAAQRDRLRQRLLALELASSAEVDALRRELRSLQDERSELIAVNRGNIGGSVPYTVHISGTTNLERVETALDMLMSFLSRKVLRNPIARRLFLGYLALLHMFVAVDLFYQVSGLF